MLSLSCPCVWSLQHEPLSQPISLTETRQPLKHLRWYIINNNKAMKSLEKNLCSFFSCQTWKIITSSAGNGTAGFGGRVFFCLAPGIEKRVEAYKITPAARWQKTLSSRARHWGSLRKPYALKPPGKVCRAQIVGCTCRTKVLIRCKADASSQWNLTVIPLAVSGLVSGG